MASPPTSTSSDEVLNDSAKPQEPPRVYDIYSYTNKSPGIPCTYIQNVDTANVALSTLNSKILGFDLEWRPNFVKGSPENPVALVQLASDETILLIHLTYMPRKSHDLAPGLFSRGRAGFPEKLRDLLLDPTVIKAGVGIQSESSHYTLNLLSPQRFPYQSKTIVRSYSSTMALIPVIVSISPFSLVRWTMSVGRASTPTQSVSHDCARRTKN